MFFAGRPKKRASALCKATQQAWRTRKIPWKLAHGNAHIENRCSLLSNYACFCDCQSDSGFVDKLGFWLTTKHNWTDRSRCLARRCWRGSRSGWDHQLRWNCWVLHISGWWLRTFLIFPYIGNVITPTDELIFFQSAMYTTNQNMLVYWHVYTWPGSYHMLALFCEKGLISDTLRCPWYILLRYYFEQRLVIRNVRIHRTDMFHYASKVGFYWSHGIPSSHQKMCVKRMWFVWTEGAPFHPVVNDKRLLNLTLWGYNPNKWPHVQTPNA